MITLDDKDLDLDDFIAQEVPKLPPTVSIKAHWLSINGVQPRIPENPTATSEDGGEITLMAVPNRVIQEAKSIAFADITVVSVRYSYRCYKLLTIILHRSNKYISKRLQKLAFALKRLAAKKRWPVYHQILAFSL